MNDPAIVDRGFSELLGVMELELNSPIITTHLDHQPAIECETFLMGADIKLKIALRRNRQNGMIEAVLNVESASNKRFIFKMKYGMTPFQPLQRIRHVFTYTGKGAQFASVRVSPYLRLLNHFVTSPENGPKWIGQILIAPVATTLSGRYPIPRVNDVDCDYLLVCGGREIWVHKRLLVKVSRFFSKQQISDPRCQATNLDKLGEKKRLELADLRGLLRYTYGLPIDEHALQTVSLLSAAREFEVNSLRAIIEGTMLMQMSNKKAPELFYIAYTERIPTLLKAAVEHLTAHFDDIKDTFAWKSTIRNFPKFFEPIRQNPMKFFRETIRSLSTRASSSKKSPAEPKDGPNSKSDTQTSSLSTSKKRCVSSFTPLDSVSEPLPMRRQRSSPITQRPPGPLGMGSLRMRTVEGEPSTFSQSLFKEKLKASEPELAAAFGPVESDSSISSESTSTFSSDSSSSSSRSKSKSLTDDRDKLGLSPVEDMDLRHDPLVDSMNNLLPPPQQPDYDPTELQFTYSCSSDSPPVKMVISPDPEPVKQETVQETLSSERTGVPHPLPSNSTESSKSPERPELAATDVSHPLPLHSTESSKSPEWPDLAAGNLVVDGVRDVPVIEDPLNYLYTTSDSSSDPEKKNSEEISGEEIPARYRREILPRYLRVEAIPRFFAHPEAGSLSDVSSIPEDPEKIISEEISGEEIPARYRREILPRYLRVEAIPRFFAHPEAGSLSDVSSIPEDPEKKNSEEISGEEIPARYRREILPRYLRVEAIPRFFAHPEAGSLSDVSSIPEDAPREPDPSHPSRRGKRMKKKAIKHETFISSALNALYDFSSSDGATNPKLARIREYPFGRLVESSTSSSSSSAPSKKKAKNDADIIFGEPVCRPLSPMSEHEENEVGNYDHWITIGENAGNVYTHRRARKSKKVDKASRKQAFKNYRHWLNKGKKRRNVYTHTQTRKSDDVKKVQEQDAQLPIGGGVIRKTNRKAEKSNVEDSMPNSSSSSFQTISSSLSSSESRAAKRTYSNYVDDPMSVSSGNYFGGTASGRSYDHYTDRYSFDQPTIAQSQSFVDLSTVRRRSDDLQQRRNIQTSITLPDIHHIEQTESTIRLFDKIEIDDKQKSDDMKRETDETNK